MGRMNQEYMEKMEKVLSAKQKLDFSSKDLVKKLSDHLELMDKILTESDGDATKILDAYGVVQHTIALLQAKLGMALSVHTAFFVFKA